MLFQQQSLYYLDWKRMMAVDGKQVRIWKKAVLTYWYTVAEFVWRAWEKPRTLIRT